MKITTNQIGFRPHDPKTAVITFTSLEAQRSAQLELSIYCDHQLVTRFPIPQAVAVEEWHHGLFSRVDISQLTETGSYTLACGDAVSHSFEIAENLLIEKTFSDLLHYFKSQRCSGKFDAHDRNAQVVGSTKKLDVHGGWYDASGDVSKYLSHLSYANYLNPQQIPMVVWNMFKSAELNQKRQYLPEFSAVRLLDEAYYGADFLVRMQDEQGFFYTTLFDKWSKDTEQRELCAYETQLGHKYDNYQAGFRQGGGMAIAALAIASTQDNQGEYTNAQYLDAAQQGYLHLIEHNLSYLDDGQENIIDFYCALLAAVELHRATKLDQYLLEARAWCDKLCALQRSDDQHRHYWSANVDGTRPYFHAAEAGLPVIALCAYLEIETNQVVQQHVQQIVSNAINFELFMQVEGSNPFGYPKQVVQGVESEKRSSFFVAQNNESGYWWQGENARLGSLAAMAYYAKPWVTQTQAIALEVFASDSLNWILGNNPYDMCMLDGHGHNNPDYLPELGYINAKGGICNGITAGFENANDIAFNPTPHKDDMLQNWRWGEQWIPHAAWFLLAVSTQAFDALSSNDATTEF
jgi:hypothetical protein